MSAPAVIVAGRVVAARLAAVVLRVASAPPDDPFGPVDQDPDALRESACRLVAPDSVCSPATPPQVTDPPDAGWLADVVQFVVLVAFVAAVALLVVLVVKALMARTRRARRRRGDDDVDDIDVIDDLGQVAVDRSREPVDWRREADEHRRAGRWRDALRCRYRALVGDLARDGVIDEIPGRTTGEERAQLAGVVPAGRPPFDAAAGLFDEAWYGHRAVGDGDLAAMEQFEHDVLVAVGEQRAGARTNGRARGAASDGAT